MKKGIRVVLIAAAVLLVLAVAVFAAGEAAVPGSEGDPLVTLSYINEVFTGYVKELFHRELTEKAETMTDSLEGRIAALEEAAAAAESREAGRTFEAVTLAEGKKLSCQPGAEVMLRSGSAKAGSAVLVDTGSAAALESGADLEVNHLYLVTEEGTISAAGTAELLLRGDYQIG